LQAYESDYQLSSGSTAIQKILRVSFLLPALNASVTLQITKLVAI